MDIYQSRKSSLETDRKAKVLELRHVSRPDMLPLLTGKYMEITHGVTGAWESVHCAFPIVLRPLVFIFHDEHDRSPQGDPKLCAAVYFYQVLFVPRRCKGALSWSSPSELGLDISFGEL